MAVTLASLLVDVRTNVDKALHDLDRVDGKVNKTSRVAKAAAKTTGVAVVAGIGASIKSFIDFDYKMNESLAIMGDLSAGMKRDMEGAARDVAKTTTFSAAQAAESYFFLASAGLDASASMKALPVVAKFAQAGMFDMATATDLLTDAQSALGLTIRDDAVKNMENMVRVSDVLAKANVLSNATVEQFSESLTNKAGAALRLLNKDVEEGVAVLAAFADQGVKGEEAGEKLNIVLRDLQTSALKNKEEFKEFGISVYDSEGNMRNMAEIIGDLEGALKGMSDEEVRATLMTLGFQDRSVAALQQLLGTSDAIARYEAELRNAGGTTEEIANKQLESFKNRLILAKNRVMDMALTVGQFLVPKLFDAADALGTLVGWISGKFATGFKFARDIVGEVQAAFGALSGDYGVAGFATIMDNILGGSGRWTDFFTTLGETILQLRDWFGQATQFVRDNWQPAMEAVGDFIERHVNPAVSALLDFLKPVGDFIQRNLTPILVVLGGAIGGVLLGALGSLVAFLGGALFSGLVGLVGLIVGPLIGAVTALVAVLASPVAIIAALVAGVIYAYKNFEGFRNVVDGVVDWIGDTLVPAFQSMADWFLGTGGPAIVDFAQMVFRWMQKVADWFLNVGIPAVVNFAKTVHEWFSNSIMPIVREVGGFIIDILSQVVGWVMANWPLISEAFSKVFGIVKDLLTDFMMVLGVVLAALKLAFDLMMVALSYFVETFKAIWRAFGDNIIALIQIAWDLITGIIQAALNVIMGIVQFVMAIFTGNWSAAWDAVKQIFSGIWDGITSGLSAALDIMIQVLDGALSTLRLAWDNAWNVMKATFEGIVTVITTVWNGIKGAFAEPINWVIRNVINKFIDAINWVADKIPGVDFNLNHVDMVAVADKPGATLHRGGVFGDERDDSRAGRTGPLRSDEGFALLQRGEGVLPVEVMRVLGRDGFDKLRQGQLDAFRQPETGGIFGDLWDATGGKLVSAVAKAARAAAAYAAEQMMKPAFGLLDRMLGMFPGGWPEIAQGGVRGLGDNILDWIKGVEDDADARIPPELGVGAGWKKQWEAVSNQFPWARLTSGVRSGSRWHEEGRAIDIAGRGRNDRDGMLLIAKWIRDNYRDSKQLVFSPLGGKQLRNGEDYLYTGKTRDTHFDHVHWAMGRGGVVTRPTRILAGEAGEPEGVLPLSAFLNPMIQRLDALRSAIVGEPAFGGGGGVGGRRGQQGITAREMEELVERLLDGARPNVHVDADLSAETDPVLVGAELAWRLR